jgi:hypothetical protein
MPDTANKYGIRGILDDTPHSDAMQHQWQKHGNFNFPEQRKGGRVFFFWGPGWRTSKLTHQQDFLTYWKATSKSTAHH